jgi:RNA polymerase sigma factor (sigma-70 family)
MTFTNKDFEKAYPKLKDYAFYLTKNNYDEAEDLLQNTFLRMLEKIEKFTDVEEKGYTIEKWGASVMHNLFIDNKRHSKVFIPPMSFDDLKRVPNMTDDSSKVHNDIIVRKKCRMLKTIIRKDIKEQKYFNSNTGEQYLQIFIYRCFGLSYMEIAKHMDSNLNTIKTKIFNMKQVIGKLLILDEKVFINSQT